MAKSFDAPGAYREEIRRLVPGYAALHHGLPTWLSAKPLESILVVGCGPGDELVELAKACPEAKVHAVDPSESMVAMATATCRRAHVLDRVTVRRGTSNDAAPDSFDAVVSVLVAHLLPDDGRREAFYAGLARAARCGGVVLNAELQHGGSDDAQCVLEHIEHGRRHGLGEQRLSLVEARLRRVFHRITEERRSELFQAALLGDTKRVLQSATLVAECSSVRPESDRPS